MFLLLPILLNSLNVVVSLRILTPIKIYNMYILLLNLSYFLIYRLILPLICSNLPLLICVRKLLHLSHYICLFHILLLALSSLLLSRHLLIHLDLLMLLGIHMQGCHCRFFIFFIYRFSFETQNELVVYLRSR